MKYEIKQVNENDAVVISDKEPKINDWYNSDLGINKLGSTTRYVEKYRHKVIATIYPFKLEGLPMLELPNQEEDIKRLALDYAKTPILNHKEQDLNTEIWISGARQQGFIDGYKAAQNKKYSEEDMRDIYNYAKIPDVILYLRDGTKKIESTSFENFIQSLQKKQFPIAVELTEDLKPIKWHYEK